MITPGLCTVTFSQKPIEEVLDLTEKAGLHAIECFGGAHVKPGDTNKARQVRALCSKKGIKIPSYGSYYRAGVGGKDGESFESVLDTALELGCDNIRIWAGDRDTDQADEAYLSRAVEDTLRIAELSNKHGMCISFEYHKGSLTDTNENAQKFAKQVERENIKFYWQPPNGKSYDYCMEGLQGLGDRLGHVHIFHWTVGSPDENRLEAGREPVWPDDYYRHLLHEGKERWMGYLEYINGLADLRYCLLEFVKDDSAESFLQDASTLREMINSLNRE